MFVWLTSLSLRASSPPMLLQIANFRSYEVYNWVIFQCVCVCVYACHIFMHSSVDAHLGCFHVLATVYKAAVNIGVHLSFQVNAFLFFGYIPKSEIDGSYGNHVFSFLRNLHTVLHSGCTSLYYHQQGTRVPFSVHAHKHLLFVGFWCQPFWQWYLITGNHWFPFLWLMMFNIFSYACWPSVYHFWKNVHSGLLPI